MHANEDRLKPWLGQRGIIVPLGGKAASARTAADVARQWSGGAVVKALVPTGRRGKAGAVRFCDDYASIEKAAADLLGTVVNGYNVSHVYVEQKVVLANEFYISFVLEGYPPQMLVSSQGGIEIEEVYSQRPEAVVATPIDPLKGVRLWDAVAQWENASVDSKLLPRLARTTVQLYDAFVAAGATLLEINPLGIDADGNCVVVGALMAGDDTAFLAGATDDVGALDDNRTLTDLERRVAEANIALPGGQMRYTELDGDIGMFIGGGGASLVQHDLILEAGGRPANHMDASTTNPDKVRVLIETILDNPRVKSLLVSWHYQQMAQIDRRVGPIVAVLKERKVDPRKFPVVIRMFGPGEDEARRAAAQLEGIHYLPHGAPLETGIRMIVDLNRRARQLSEAS